MAFIRVVVFSAFLIATSCASALAPKVNTEREALRPGNYELDTEHAALLFKVGHLGFSRYVGRFERFNVALLFDESDPTAARIDAIIDMTSLNVANPKFSKKLQGPKWFDAEQFPQARFRSTDIRVTGENTGILIGDFTMHGITQPIEMDVVFNGGGFDALRGAYILGLSATTKIKRSDFGVDRFKRFVKDTVEIEIEAEFIRNGGTEQS
ncbi:MAG: YceI family protein [Pseudomonadota bacterium]